MPTQLFRPDLHVRRAAAMHSLRLQVSEVASRLAWPRIEVPANRVFFRFVKQDEPHLRTYTDVFRLPPNIPEVGGLSTKNRFTGVLPTGAAGLSGSYWGTADGVAAEDHYYQCWKDYDGSGPPRLMAAQGHLLVQRALGKLKYGMDGEVPTQLLFSGNCAANLLVARTIRPVASINLNLSDDRVQEFLAKVEPLFRRPLDVLEFPDITSAIEDGEFRDFARSLAHGAALSSRAEGLWVRSVRDQASGLPGFDPDQANNLVLLGDASATLTDRLVGCGVIEIRSDAQGLHVSAAPLHGQDARYADPAPKALMVIPTPDTATSGGEG